MLAKQVEFKEEITSRSDILFELYASSFRIQCSSEATCINTNKKTSADTFNHVGVHFEGHFCIIVDRNMCFFADVWSWKPE